VTIKHADEYREEHVSRAIIEKILSTSQKQIRLMEVCGTHTMAIFRNGLRTVLPNSITLVSGPGCPVCVTAQGEIDAFIDIAGKKDVITATFGDLLRVPGTRSSLLKERANGKDVRIVYSTFDAIQIAKQNPEKKVVFLGVGFETTAPTVAASIKLAEQTGVQNFYVFSAHKKVPPALEALGSKAEIGIDGFLLPGHVSVIIGQNAYKPFYDKHNTPAVIAGFEPADILQAIWVMVELIESGNTRLANEYKRAVLPEGNLKAQKIMRDVFETVDTNWRGLGTIPDSGLEIKNAFKSFDAKTMFQLNAYDSKEPDGCACGKILTGLMRPPDCPLYGKSCTPVDPVGPCMVSSEGTCAAYYRYDDGSYK